MSWTSSRNRKSGPGGQNSLTGIPSRGGSKGLGAVRAPRSLAVWGRARGLSSRLNSHLPWEDVELQRAKQGLPAFP